MKLFEKFSHKEKKELTPQQQKVKVALNWTVNILCIILIIFALVVAIFTIIRSTNPDRITRVGDNCYFNVASDSMKPTFTKDDVIIAKAYEGDGSDLKIGQVITYKFVRYYNGVGYDEYNSHRLIGIEGEGDTRVFRTRGDNQEGSWKEALNDSTSWDDRRVVLSDIVATWGDVDEDLNFTNGRMLKGVGGLANFMQDPIEGRTRFFCLIVLPLILLFVIYAFILVRTLIIAKLEKDKKVAGETAISVDAMTEEEKNALIAQLLASQNKSAEPVPDSEETVKATDTDESAEAEDSVSEDNGAEVSDIPAEDDSNSQSDEVADSPTEDDRNNQRDEVPEVGNSSTEDDGNSQSDEVTDSAVEGDSNNQRDEIPE